MKIDLNSKYLSSSSYAKKQTIPIDMLLDPRLTSLTANFKIARQNAEYTPIGEGKNLAGLLLTLKNQALFSYQNPHTGSDGGGSGNPPGLPSIGTPPLQVENLTAAWGDDDSIVLNFDFDPNDEANQYIAYFKVKLKNSADKLFPLRSGVGYDAQNILDLASISQEIIIPWEDWSGSGIQDPETISQVGVATADILQTGDYVYADLNAGSYVPSLPTPEFTLSAGVDYYVVNISNLSSAISKGTYYGIIVEEYISPITVKAQIPQPTTMTNGWVQATALTTNSVVVIYTPDEAHRWVRVKYLSKSGRGSTYSDIQDITPLPFQQTNTNPPGQFSSASIQWVGNDVRVNFTQPSSNSGNTVKVKLVPYINGVESTSLYAYYYHIINGSETFFTIPSLDLYGQFGTYYSTFKAYITSVSAQGVETTGAVITSGPITRSSSISSIYPTLGTPNVNSPTGVFRVNAISNGYVVEFDLPSGATRLEVYEKSTAWTTVPTDDSNMVYSGLSPAVVITPDTNNRYVIVRYYDQYDNYSHYSMEKSGQTSGVLVSPVDIGRNSLIANPIKIQTDGSIFSGAGGSTVYPQVFFNKDGLFAYDASGNWTTEIINSATTNAPTFITKRAVIGDWTINPAGIQNDLYASGPNKTYTGMSASGTYAFWAGSGTSNNSDGLAKFSVTPGGAVVSRSISIIGDGTGGDLIRAGGSKFTVNQNGDLTATSATITGSLTVDQQSYFDSNVNVRNGYIIAGSGGPNSGPNVQIDSTGLSARSASAVTTKIYSSAPDVSGIAGVSLWSKKALFGSTTSSGWLIEDGVMKSDYVTLNSANHQISIYSTNNAYGVQLNGDVDTSNKALVIGNLSNPSFYVTHAGKLVATNAEISGTITANQVDIGNYGVNVWNSSQFYVSATGAGTGQVGDIIIQAGTMSGQEDTNDGDEVNSLAVYNMSYSGRIRMNSSGTQIFGLPKLGDYSKYGGGGIYTLTQKNYNNSSYGMGAGARQRTIVMDPYDKQLYRGFAIYYGSRSTAPSAGTGHVGDIWVSWS
ncbi:MAG: hypothetical protein RLZZ196_74 [Bacteroidota bacterium]|jgi:hypothetical protein